MKVRLARTAGFCMGVRRAVEMALEEGNKTRGTIVTFGPLIHNTEVLELLAEKGIQVLEDPARLTGRETAIIRAHGVPPAIKDRLKAGARRVVDATCPRVVKVQVLIRRYTGRGCQAIIVGDKDHAEVRGLLGHAQDQGVVVSEVEEIPALPDYDRVMVVAQTTQSETLFQEVVEAVKKRWPRALIFNTICPATHERQAEVMALAQQVEGVVVVGGSFSANTQRLVKLAAGTGKPAFGVESEADLDRAAIQTLRSVGVTAGASTPNWLIRKVVEELRGLRARGENRVRSVCFRVFRFLLKSNSLVALGGAGLALAGGLAMGIGPSLSLIVVPALYLYAMHILNHFLDRKAAVYNDPDLFRFYAKHRVYLISTASLAALTGLVQSARLGPASFLTLTTLSALGLIYPVPLVPARWVHLTRYAKIKDFPGSKPLVIGLAWASICGLWPALTFGRGWTPANWLVFVLIASLAFIRAAFVDVLDIQGDLVVGKETLAINLGEDRSYHLLLAISILSVALAGAGVLTGLLGRTGWVLCLAPAGLGAVILAWRKKKLMPGIFLDGLVEASLLLAGGLGWLLLALGSW